MDFKYWCNLCEAWVEPEKHTVSDKPWSYVQEHMDFRTELRCPYCGGEIPEKSEEEVK